MRKTVEIEYVGIEDIQDMMDDVYALMREGHYASFEMSNIGNHTRIRLAIMLGGWSSKSNYDYEFEFYMTDKEADVTEMNKCKATLNNLLTWNKDDNKVVLHDGEEV